MAKQENKKANENILTNPLIVFLLMFVACFLWGSAFSCVKIGYRLFRIERNNIASMLTFAGLRYILAGLLLLVFGGIFQRNEFKLNNSKLKAVGINTLFQVLGQYTFYYIGIANTPAVRTAIINSTTVFISIFLSVFIFKSEKYNITKFVSSIMAIIGVIILNYNKDMGLSFHLKGEGFVLLSCTNAAISTCLQKDLTKSTAPSALCSYSFLFGGIVFLSLGLIFNGYVSPVDWRAYIMLLYLALISSIAFTIQSTLLKYNDVSQISIYRIMNPIIGVIISAILIKDEQGQLFRVNTLVAAVVIICAILLLKLTNREKNKK